MPFRLDLCLWKFGQFCLRHLVCARNTWRVCYLNHAEMRKSYVASVVSLLLIGTVKLLSFFRDTNYPRDNSFERVSILEQSHSQGVALRLSGAKMNLTREESKQAQKHCCSAPCREAGIGTRTPYAVVEFQFP